MVDVTGALITDCSNCPIGSRVSTTMGRTLSSRASHTSPRRGPLLIGFGLRIDGFPVGLVGQAVCRSQSADTQFRIGGRNPPISGNVPAKAFSVDQTFECQIDNRRS